MPAMRKIDVLAHYANDTHAIARAIGTSRQAVEKWPDVVPIGSAVELETITKGDLKVNLELYRKARKKKAGAR